MSKNGENVLNFAYLTALLEVDCTAVIPLECRERPLNAVTRIVFKRYLALRGHTFQRRSAVYCMMGTVMEAYTGCVIFPSCSK